MVPPLKELARRLTMAGLEVEEVNGVGDAAVLTLGITPNRGDCLSIVGIARELAAIGGKKFHLKTISAPKGEGKIDSFLKVSLKDSRLCPRYMARIVRGARVGLSPEWLRKKLEAVGLRPINNVVDATNFVLWELGHPLHAFDYRKLSDKKVLRIETLKAEGPFQTLDREKRHCNREDLFIWDAERPVALAGIMGGENSEITDKTTDIILEAAFFEPTGIHRTSKRLKLNSDSSTRFERGVDPNGVERALHRVTEILVATAGGKPTSDWIDLYPKKIRPVSIPLPRKEITRHLGITLLDKKVADSLTALGCTLKKSAKGWSVSVPTWRFDMRETIDLVEETARITGFDKIPETLPRLGMRQPTKPPLYEMRQKTCELLTDWGYQETCHLTFVSEKKEGIFLLEEKPVRVINPLSERDVWMRPLITPSLLDAVAFNQNRQRESAHLFELGKIFRSVQGNILERWHLAAVATGFDPVKEWFSPDKKVDFYSLKGVLEGLRQSFGFPSFQFCGDSTPNFLEDSESARIQVDGKEIGWCGLFHAKTIAGWGIEQAVYGFEIDLEPLLEWPKSPTIFQPISKFPFVERDIALLADVDMTVESIESALRNGASPWVSKIELFDLYSGKNLPSGKKSLAFNIRYESFDRTLTNDEVNRAHQDLVARLCRELPVSLRE